MIHICTCNYTFSPFYHQVVFNYLVFTFLSSAQLLIQAVLPVILHGHSTPLCDQQCRKSKKKKTKNKLTVAGKPFMSQALKSIQCELSPQVRPLELELSIDISRKYDMVPI